ncbi:MAG: hypothetical protein GC178_18130 [Flavobacteriales bacterium]|nr:hypothetical protein [Flavobacteriales bacterium]
MKHSKATEMKEKQQSKTIGEVASRRHLNLNAQLRQWWAERTIAQERAKNKRPTNNRDRDGPQR